MSKIVLDSIIDISYARAFFVTAPDASPLMPGETRFFPMHYTRGDPPGTAFELVWYANRTDADAQEDELTDTDRLPSAAFSPFTPNQDAGAETLQDGDVRLTAPESNGYTNPVGVILVTQETGTVEPLIYLLADTFDIPTTPFSDYDFRYFIGEPPIIAWAVEWYASRLDAKRQINRLTDTARLPRAAFSPFTPNQDAEPETLQDGMLRLHLPASNMPYSSAYGVLCVEQGPLKGDSKNIDVDAINVRQRHSVCPNWEDA